MDYETTLNKLAARKWIDLKSEKNIFTRKGKTYKYLIQKGYEPDMVKDTIEELSNMKKL